MIFWMIHYPKGSLFAHAIATDVFMAEMAREQQLERSANLQREPSGYAHLSHELVKDFVITLRVILSHAPCAEKAEYCKKG